MLNPWTDFGATGARRCSRLLPPVSGWNTSGCLPVTGVQASMVKFLVYARVINIKVRRLVWGEMHEKICCAASFENQCFTLTSAIF